MEPPTTTKELKRQIGHQKAIISSHKKRIINYEALLAFYRTQIYMIGAESTHVLTTGDMSREKTLKKIANRCKKILDSDSSKLEKKMVKE